MNKSAICVWKNARNNADDDFPNCPDDLSEPAYANLAFDFHCHVCAHISLVYVLEIRNVVVMEQNCLTTNVRNVRWALRVRYCARCSRTW